MDAKTRGAKPMGRWRADERRGGFALLMKCGLLPALVAVALLGEGCGPAGSRGSFRDHAEAFVVPEEGGRTPLYPVFVNPGGDRGPGVYVWVKLRPPTEEAGDSTLRLSVWNRTGRAIFLARIGEHPHTWLYYDIEYEGGGMGGVAFNMKGGGPETYDLLFPMPTLRPGEALICDRPMHTEVIASVGSSGIGPYADVEVTFPLAYYALGATEPVRINVKETVRVPYGDGAPPTEAPARPPEDLPGD